MPKVNPFRIASLVDVPGDVEGVLQVPLDLVEDVLGGAPQQDGARLRVNSHMTSIKC